jgi:hypothetical protein
VAESEHEDDLAPLPDPASGDDTPPIDFATFVLSLSTTCMIQLGEIESPEAEADLDAARHTLEILEMLEAKTRGNLSGDEERVLGHVLADLRSRYVAKVGK